MCPPESDKFGFLKEHFGTTLSRIETPAIDVDVVIDCAGASNIIDDFLNMCKPKSRLSIAGLSLDFPEISLMEFVISNTSIWGACSYDDEDIQEAIDILAKGKVDFSDIITHHYKLDQINEAMAMAADRAQSIKVIIDME